jgi:NADPH-dependent 2,4-dienoyl-CoA reductase/sulfur reductase-like enzyme
MTTLQTRQIVVIGGGPAGLAAAVAAHEAGVRDVLILEREHQLGGILNQCIHTGFGLHTFKEELTGPEYADRYIDKVRDLGIEAWLDTMVIDVSKERIITMISPKNGLIQIAAGAVVLAMGCRERPRGALNIPGFRPAGIFSAGTAQRFVNMEGYLPGKEVVILGSGDIGLIMARRMTLEGATVKMVVELLPYSGGLKRNIVQCLDDFDIPLKLSHTVTRIHGKYRVEGVTVQAVDSARMPIPGTEEFVACDTLLLSVGLIPENELSRKAGVAISAKTSGPLVNESFETSVPGMFACGNVLHVHDLVDWVSQEAAEAGKNAAVYVMGNHEEAPSVTIQTGLGVRYTVPGAVRPSRIFKSALVRFRVSDVYKNHFVVIRFDETVVLRQKKRILTPGEMEQVLLLKTWFDANPNVQIITVSLEKEEAI